MCSKSTEVGRLCSKVGFAGLKRNTLFHVICYVGEDMVRKSKFKHWMVYGVTRRPSFRGALAGNLKQRLLMRFSDGNLLHGKTQWFKHTTHSQVNMKALLLAITFRVQTWPPFMEVTTAHTGCRFQFTSTTYSLNFNISITSWPLQPYSERDSLSYYWQ